MNQRIRWAGWHLLLSAGLALVGAVLVFGVWYPQPYTQLSGGLGLFAILMGVDMVLGPMLTALVASSAKPRKELRRDIGLIVVLQLLALGYGMYSIANARPVHIVFEIDRFRVVSAADVDPSQLQKAGPAYRRLPWTGPTVVGARKSSTNQEMVDALDLAMQGMDLAMQPARWEDYALHVPAVLKAARPAAQLVQQYPGLEDQIQAIGVRHHVAQDRLLFLPIDARKDQGVVLLDAATAHILAYVPVDGYF
jgi:hypothetical protein